MGMECLIAILLAREMTNRSERAKDQRVLLKFISRIYSPASRLVHRHLRSSCGSGVNRTYRIGQIAGDVYRKSGAIAGMKFSQVFGERAAGEEVQERMAFLIHLRLILGGARWDYCFLGILCSSSLGFCRSLLNLHIDYEILWLYLSLFLKEKVEFVSFSKYSHCLACFDNSGVRLSSD